MLELLRLKEESQKKLRELVGAEGARKAARNPHAKRRPRPCGVTVHPGFGCPNRCLYCYVEDMVSGRVRANAQPVPCSLTGLEMAFALASNPYFLPGGMGTFIALGAVCDPLHPTLLERTLDYLAAFRRHLGNPTQFSTKMHVDPYTAGRIADSNESVSPLVTVVTLSLAGRLEPGAPTPWERLDGIRNLREAGLKPMLFLRPLIPGVSDEEVDDLLTEAKGAGAVGVVVGALRVSQPILRRLERAGVDTTEIRRRLGRPVGSRLITVASPELKSEALSIAREKGLIPFASACCANAYTSGVPCAGLCWLTGFCTKCPNRCWEKLPEVDEGEVREALRLLLHVDPVEVDVEEWVIRIRVPRGVKAPDLQRCRVLMRVATRRDVIFTR